MSQPDLGRLLREPASESEEAGRAERIVLRAERHAGRGDITRLIGIQGWAGLFLVFVGLLEVLLGSKHVRERRDDPDGGDEQ